MYERVKRGDVSGVAPHSGRVSRNFRHRFEITIAPVAPHSGRVSRNGSNRVIEFYQDELRPTRGA